MTNGSDSAKVQEEMKREQIRQSGRYSIAPPPAVAPPPVALDDGEELLEYRKPRPFAYTPLLFGTLFGLVLFLMFLMSGNIVAIALGAAIWGGLHWFLRTAYYRRAGYWFTGTRLIIDDGSRVSMVPYEEIALSSIVLEEDGLLFSTIYGREFIVRGTGNPGNTADFLMRKGRERRAGSPGHPLSGRPSS